MDFRLLGLVCLHHDGRVVRVTGVKQRTLLAALLLAPRRTASVPRLTSVLWGEDDPPSSAALLHHHVSSLRRLLGDSSVIDRDPSGYVMRIREGTVDAEVFDAEVAVAGRELELGDAGAAAERLRRALELWRGPALGGVTDELLRLEGPALAQRHLAARVLLGEAELALGDHDAAVGRLTGLVAEHPFDERLRSRLMEALSRAGRQAEALGVYAEGRALLHDELGLEPGPELCAAHQAVLTAKTPPSSSPAPSGPGSRAPASRLRTVPRQLPPTVRSFVGREDQLAELTGRLGQGRDGAAGTGAAALVITGSAGIGKTTLALHCAHRLVDRFPDGQLYVDLHGFSTVTAPLTPGQALERLLRSLGVTADEMPVDTDERAGLLRTLLADSRLLLLLDNAATAEQVRPLLQGSQRCRVLITSRHALRGLLVTHDVRTLTLGLLTPEQSERLLRMLLGTERCDGNEAAVADLARLCGYLPLALRLAAAHLATRPRLSPAEFAARLDREGQLAVLDVDDDLHSGIRAAFELSYGSLPTATRRAYRLIGLHPGTEFSTAAVGALIGAGPADAAAELDRLACSHLVHQTSAERWQMHDLLREFAVAKLELDSPQEERDAAGLRVVDWYLRACEEAMDMVDPHRRRLAASTAPPVTAAAGAPRPESVEDAGAWLETECANAVAAVGLSALRGLHDRTVRLAHALWRHFLFSRRTGDWIATHQLALAAARETGDIRGEAETLTNLATAHMITGAAAEGTALYERALPLRRACGDRAGEAATQGNLGNAYFRAGRLAEATGCYRSALRLFGELDDVRGQANTLNSLGMITALRGRAEEASAAYEQALVFYRKINDGYGEANALVNLGALLSGHGSRTEARTCLQQALSIFQRIGDPGGQAEAQSKLGRLAVLDGHAADALPHLTQALEHSRLIRDQALEAQVLNDIGEAHRAIGSHRSAVAHYQVVLAGDGADRHERARAELGIGLSLLSFGDTESALPRLRQALDTFEQLGAPEAEEVRAELDRLEDA